MTEIPRGRPRNHPVETPTSTIRLTLADDLRRDLTEAAGYYGINLNSYIRVILTRHAEKQSKAAS